jgi:phosphate/sulfate permease
MSNLAIFLPRSLNIGEMVLVCVIIFFGLGIMLYQGGEKIQRVVDEKSRVKDLPEATVVNLLYAVVLFVFKIYSKIPMSTTWCFVGLLAGREIAMAFRKIGDKSLKEALAICFKDFAAVSFGFIASLLIGMGANEHVRTMMSNAF